MRMIAKIFFTTTVLAGTIAHATGHFQHERGKSGAWFWKDIQGSYSAHTNGTRAENEGLNVFCDDPDSRGGVSLSLSLKGTQTGKRKLTFNFDNGVSVDVIANYGSVVAQSPTGRKIIGNILKQLRTAGQVLVAQKGAPIARFSLHGSGQVLKRCP